MITSVVLLRHGRTGYNFRHRIQGQIDVPLDIVGRWQAQMSGMAIAQRFAWASIANHARRPEYLQKLSQTTYTPVDLDEYRLAPAAINNLEIYSSDLSRAYETALSCANILGIKVHKDIRLRERSYGVGEGKTDEEIRLEYEDGWRQWRTHGPDSDLLGLEPVAEVGARGQQFIQELVDKHRDESFDTTLLLVAHGALIIWTLAALLDMPVTTVQQHFSAIRNACWSSVDPVYLEDGSIRWKLAELNQGPPQAYGPDWFSGPTQLQNPSMQQWVNHDDRQVRD